MTTPAAVATEVTTENVTPATGDVNTGLPAGEAVDERENEELVDYDEYYDIDEDIVILEELVDSSESDSYSSWDDEYPLHSPKRKSNLAIKKKVSIKECDSCETNRISVKKGAGKKKKLAAKKKKLQETRRKQGEMRGVVPSTKKESHAGHKRVKPVKPCSPEKLGQCLNVSRFILPGQQVACLNINYCTDDCDCPSRQKCCTNACNALECLPAIVDTSTDNSIDVTNGEVVTSTTELSPETVETISTPVVGDLGAIDPN